MRRIRQVLQLHFGACPSARVIAGTVGVGRSTVPKMRAGGVVCWPRCIVTAVVGLENDWVWLSASSLFGMGSYDPLLLGQMARPPPDVSLLADSGRFFVPA